ncbi:MAG TPA: alpha/beta hydrolase [Sandaracinaceae bacterium LLY-WYZ-13_1]|nr:alpha/beta hydrolase [Sandaracinaceae bacterium LLY-WYZ-13_1]
MAFAVLAAVLCLGFGPRPGSSRSTTRRRAAAGATSCLAPLSRATRRALRHPRDDAGGTRITFAGVRGRALRLDLVVPESAGPHPLVVLVHGGAWRRGHRSYLTGTMHAFAAQGFAAATVDYRLAAAPRNVFPGPVSDVRCAVRTLRARSHELGLDPERFAAVGFSAGAHLAGLLATARDVDALDDESCPVAGGSPAVQAAVAFYGAYDLRAPLRVGPGAEGAIRNFLGVSRRADPRRAALASPVTHVDRDDPPMLLVHGLRDRVVEVDQTRRMRRALERAGVPVTAFELPHRRHGFGLFPRRPTDDERLACATLGFLRERLADPRPRRHWARR